MKLHKIPKMGLKKAIMGLLFLFVTGILLMAMYCGKNLCFQSTVYRDSKLPTSAYDSYISGMLPMNSHHRSDLNKKVYINIEKDDVFVFLHIQKTGGTSFGKHLVKHLAVDPPCQCVKKRKRCECYTKEHNIWLFSRYSTGWICGLHADWTTLKDCVDEAIFKKEKKHRPKRYHYITMMRDPIKRFLSEWRHVERGATWKTARLYCQGREASREQFPYCYNGSDWTGVTLDEFLACDYNLAINRQARMLANLSMTGCYNMSGVNKAKRDEIMLESAKENLLKFDYFGMTEFQQYSQQLFEYTFGLEFLQDFEQSTFSKSSGINITDQQKTEVLQENAVDIKLYQFAKDLFLQRVRQMKRTLNDDTEVFDQEFDKDRFNKVEDIDDDSDEENYEEDEAKLSK